MTLTKSILPLCICGDSLCTIPYGYCHCRCGRKTSLCRDNDKTRHYVAGTPNKYLPTHGSKKPVQIEDAVPFRIEGVYCRLIPLTRGQYAIVDATDYKLLMQWRWFARRPKKLTWYAIRGATTVDGKHTTTTMHQQIMGLDGSRQVDHKSVDGLDNRRRNLRPATQNQQMQNRKRQSNNSTGFKGVSYNEKRDRYCARICVNGVAMHLGWFRTAEEAHEAYKAAALKYFGEFARFE